jgi:hypothetical protein
MPFAQASGGIRVDVAAEVAAGVTLLPDQPLQCLERRDLAIGRDPLEHLGDQRILVPYPLRDGARILEQAATCGSSRCDRTNSGRCSAA